MFLYTSFNTLRTNFQKVEINKIPRKPKYLNTLLKEKINL